MMTGARASHGWALMLFCVTLAADQATKYAVVVALGPACEALTRQGATPPELLRCDAADARFRLAPAVTTASLAMPNGTVTDWRCAADAPCFDGVLRLRAPPARAEVSGPEATLSAGPATLVTRAGGALSSLRFRYRVPVVVPLVEDFLELRYVENPGASFGFLADAGAARLPLLHGLSLLVLVGTGFVYARLSHADRRLRFGLALLASGTCGNFLDRVRLDFVVDFLAVHAGEAWRWPAFNVADVVITAGVALVVLDLVASRRRRGEFAA